MAEGVSAPTKLKASFRVFVREGRRGTWGGVTRRFLILLKRTECVRWEAVSHIYDFTVFQWCIFNDILYIYMHTHTFFYEWLKFLRIIQSNQKSVTEGKSQKVKNQSMFHWKLNHTTQLTAKLNTQSHTHLFNPQQASIHGSTLYSTLSLRAASCLVAQLPHLLYSNGQCPVTHNITHHWRGGPRWHATVHESPPISFHHAFRDLPI